MCTDESPPEKQTGDRGTERSMPMCTDESPPEKQTENKDRETSMPNVHRFTVKSG